MKNEKLETQIEGERMSKSKADLDQTAWMVPVVGAGIMAALMLVFYVRYRRRQPRPATAGKRAEQRDMRQRRRAPSLAEAGGLPPVKSASKEGQP